jgi:hypothetical protein
LDKLLTDKTPLTDVVVTKLRVILEERLGFCSGVAEGEGIALDCITVFERKNMTTPNIIITTRKIRATPIRILLLDLSGFFVF